MASARISEASTQKHCIQNKRKSYIYHYIQKGTLQQLTDTTVDALVLIFATRRRATHVLFSSDDHPQHLQNDMLDIHLT